MIGVVGQLLPLMLATALSTVPILVTITILLAPRSTASALLFLIGMIFGSFLTTGLLAYGVQAVPAFSSLRSEPAVGVAEMAIGLAFIAFGVVLMVRGGRTEAEMPQWMRAVGTIKPVTALGLALLLTVRPKALLVSTAAGLIIGTNRLTTSETVVVLAIFAVVGGSTVAIPVILALARPHAARRPLQAAEQWIVRNARTVTVIVLFLIGTMILGDGLTRL